MRALRWQRLLGHLCLLLPVCAVLCVPLYSRGAPHLFGLPFFYWYQLAWVAITPALMFAAYRLRRGRDDGHPQVTAP